MARCIPHVLRALTLVGLLACVANPLLPQEHWQAPDALASCWQALGAEDAELAFRAAGQLLRAPEAAVPLLSKHLNAAKAPDSARIQACLKDLSSANFAVRERAYQELRTLDELAELPLRKAREAKLDLETGRRVQLLLSNLDRPVASPEKLRQLRAVELLEMLASPQARELLQSLAHGYPEHRQTRQAQESLLRLKQRHPVPERWLGWGRRPPNDAGEENRLPFGAVSRLGTTRFRHQGQGQQGAFSPDGRLLLSHDQEAVYLWETQTGRLQRRFDIATSCLAVAPQGTLMALGVPAQDQKSAAVVCRDWQAGKERHRLELPRGVSPRQLAYSPDGAKVLCQRSDDTLCAWDLKSGQETVLWKPADGLRKLHGFSRDGTVVVVEAKDKNYLLDLKKDVKHVLPTMERGLGQVSFSPDGRYVAMSCDYPGERLHVIDAATGKHLWRTSGGFGAYAYSIRFSGDGQVMAVASHGQGISLWDVQTGKFLRGLAGSKDCSVGAVSADGRWLASAGQAVGIWDLESGQQVDTGDGHRGIIDGLVLSPRYDWIATYDRKEVRLWDPLTGKQKRLLDTGGTFIRGLAVSPDGRLVAAANPGPGEGFIKVWEGATGRLVYKLPGHAMREYGRYADVHFSPDSRFLLSWGDDGYHRKWDATTGRALQEIQTQPPGQKREERFGGSQVQRGWTAQFDRFLRLEPNGDLHTFDLNTGKKGPVVNLGATNFGSDCAFSPTARHVARFERNIGLAVRDTTTGKLVFTVSVSGWPRGLAFSPDSRMLAAAVDGKIVLVEMATGKARLTIGGKAQALTFSADGRFLAAAMSDTTTLLLDLARLATAPQKEVRLGQ